MQMRNILGDTVTRRYTEQEWIALARTKHGERYLYDSCSYAGMAAKVAIQCREHGPFAQKALDHVNGSGCPRCGAQSRQRAILQSRAQSRVSTQELIKRFKDVHGHTYDYAQVEASGSKRPVTIVCREHGSFRQLPFNHLKGSGCPKCGTVRAGERHKLNQQEFEKRVRAVHGGRYGLGHALYATQYDNVIVECNEHGQFFALPFNLWQGGGCPRCALRQNGLSHRITQADYLFRVNQIHGTTYDHSLIRFERMHDKIVVICRDHGQFTPTAVNYLAGRGCPDCGHSSASAKRTPKLVLETGEVLARFRGIHGNYYDYTKVVYRHSNHHVEIVCRQHGSFLQTPNSHRVGKGCPECGRVTRAAAQVLTTEEVVPRFRQVHGDRYDYASTEYVRFRQRVTIRCPRHGHFLQTPPAHLEGKGCPRCSQSSGETRAAAWLQKHDIAFTVEFPVDIKGSKRCRFDFFLPDHCAFLEIDGPHHFAAAPYGGISLEKAQHHFQETKRRDALKEEWAAANGMLVYRIRWDAKIEECLGELFRALTPNNLSSDS
jgi:hypothetical protein